MRVLGAWQARANGAPLELNTNAPLNKQLCCSVDSFQSPPRFGVSSFVALECALRRAYWNGFLKLSFVSCPVALYPATTAAERVSFPQVNRRTGHRLKHQLVDSITGETVETHDKETKVTGKLLQPPRGNCAIGECGVRAQKSSGHCLPEARRRSARPLPFAGTTAASRVSGSWAKMRQTPHAARCPAFRRWRGRS